MSADPAQRPDSDLYIRSRRFIPGGVSSMNRLVSPPLAFKKAEGAYLWATDGKRYIDFHAGFAPYLLGHNCPNVNRAVVDVLQSGESLYGSGPSALEADLAEAVCASVPSVEKVTFLNTGSEATALAIRLSRAITGRSHFIVMQGGYNGNHDELACNVFNSLEQIGPRVSPGEYPIMPLGAGTVVGIQRFVHIVNFNDLESIRYVCRRYPVAAVITEPVLQNVGVLKAETGYLQGLRALADELGFLLIFDEVKTGFRYALGGYSSIAGVRPDLCTFGKAVANGFPIAMLGGKASVMDIIADPDPAKRPFVAGTYNGHPVGVAAAIATIRLLRERGTHIYSHLERLGRLAEDGINAALQRRGVPGLVSRQGSAFSFYLMDHIPRDFHDLLAHHDFDRDLALRHAMIDKGVYFVPVATKQCSISLAHTEADIAFAVEAFDECLAAT